MITLDFNEFIDLIPESVHEDIPQKLNQQNSSKLKELIKNSLNSIHTSKEIIPTSSESNSGLGVGESEEEKVFNIQAQSLNMNDVILDVENLNQIPSNSDEYENENNGEQPNPEVLEYLEFKKNHQLKFMKEIKEKNLNLKSNVGSSNKFMNY
ncbi:uncharacterized protein KGF55_003009 [Candida pseudojiufengensis]|uniref:uncharacterized protein n=1 Tax=Candida pseudojiufengensis TaxID=497109 RepID=UPI0022244DF7|nr:uncharacterized protein KGF55_003009 [Candida pseudojiufengensis]KAI5963217.1 hypothetical protein KGF55_003009 [Candida pseudojiufengensis]